MAVSDVIYQIEPEYLRNGVLEQVIYPALNQRYYWSQNWDPAFYIELARAGFITVAAEEGDQIFLLPEMQEAYAVLDWQNLRVSRAIKRLIRNDSLSETGAYVRVVADPTAVISGIQKVYGPKCWIKKEYSELLCVLAALESPQFCLHAVELYAQSSGGTASGSPILIGGELGYTIGKTYTSLSGFLRRDLPGSKDMGTVQLHCLARVLEKCGYAFWNLGHPYMDYKFQLGALALPRGEFLGRWFSEREGSPARRLSTLHATDFLCAELLAPPLFG